MTVDRGYFDLAKQLLITIGQIATTVLYFNLLLHYFRGGKKYEKLRNLPGIILLYFGYHALFSLAACPYAIYDASTLILEVFKIQLFESYQTFVSGSTWHHFVEWLMFLSNNYLFLGTFPVLFLAVERCVRFKCPQIYNATFRRNFIVASCVVFSVAYIFIILTYVIDLPFGLETVTVSPSSFLVGDIHVYMPYRRFKVPIMIAFDTKTVVEGVTLCVIIYFCKLLRKCRNVQISMDSAKLNNLVKVTLVQHIILNVFATFVGVAFTMLKDEDPALYHSQIPGYVRYYVASYLYMTFVIQTFICGVLYSKAFLSKPKAKTRSILTISKVTSIAYPPGPHMISTSDPNFAQTAFPARLTIVNNYSFFFCSK
ncbi:hypothetical protein DdX_12954 [Ditylenchus destructor]|uniref:Uncharacterized protein n=1 Tax=Ditylenchus destructor TaxID=166010 RepID=A0AAD4QZX1_9BILA|nr:hypothetical protein DdX_12954 [Ditylenchus destructor]